MNNGKRVGGILMIVFGSLFLFMGILFGSIFGLAGYAIKNESDMVDKDFEELKEDAMTTTGVVVETDDGLTIIEYYAQEDDTYYETSCNVRSSSYEVGSEVTVYYDADEPQDAMVPELYEETYGLLNTIFSGFGFAFVGFFVILGLPLLIGGIVLMKKAKVPHDNGVSQEI